MTTEERERLNRLIRGDKHAARIATRARILLKIDAGWKVPQVASSLDVAEGTVYRVKRRYADAGIDGVLHDQVQANRFRKLDDKAEAHPVSSTGQALIALACSEAPKGRQRWTLQLLADVREPFPAQPGRPRRVDYEFRRAGTRNLFLLCEPLAGWRHVAITQRRTMVDFAHQMRGWWTPPTPTRQ